MKKILFSGLAIIAILAAVLLIKGENAVVYAGGPWEVKVEGNGTVSGGSLPSWGVMETDIGWNFKWDGSSDKPQGVLNIVEKLTDGTTRHFMLYGYQCLDVEDPAVRKILFNCASGGGLARSVRVEGTDSQGRLIAAHWRDSEHTTLPNTVWYWVQDPPGTYVTNTGTQLTVSNAFTMTCN